MDTSVLSEKVLVLNRSWVAVNVATVRRALILVYQADARIVAPDDYSTFDFEGWVEASQAAKAEARRIHSATFSMCVPEVIVLGRFNGRFAKEVRFSRRNIFERDDNTCQYCGKKFERNELTLDHVIPRCRGGASTWTNVVLACLKCNMRKGNCVPNELNMKLMRKPVKPQWATRVGVKLGRLWKPSWERFLEEAYWDVELSK
jgi:5-methylcytosine-specific restriction endonuclease McrA